MSEFSSALGFSWPKKFFKALGNELFPDTCALCMAPGQGLCSDCSRNLDLGLESTCVQCAIPLAATGVCGACLRDRPAYDRSVAAGLYMPPFDQLVLDLKYRAQLALARILAQRLASCIDRRNGTADVPDILVAVPLSSLRLAERGFNQAMEIARPLGQLLGVPVRTPVVRIRHTEAQAALPLTQRRKNVRDAFLVRDPVAGLRIGVVDDVMTTGSTLDEFARALKRAGAREVQNLVVARTPRA